MALLALTIGGLMAGGSSWAQDDNPHIRLISIEGVIDPRMADYVGRGIEAAEKDQARAVLLTLDTPGGLDDPMRDIIKKIVNSPLPVITYVYPSGARAASAGTFIMMSADVAAMAPGTNIGAAYPIAVGADNSTEQGIKVLNDAAAYMRAMAETNGRNANWAELAVRQSISASADEALSQNVIDFTAANTESLMREIDGFTTVAKGITIDVTGVTIEEIEMSAWEQATRLLLNPNVVYLLLLAGLLAIAYEFTNPGIGLGAAAGFICLGLAIYALLVLPVNVAGLVLIILGFGLLVADLYIASHGLLSAGGVAGLILGSYLLFDSSAPFLRISLPLNIALALVTAGFFVVVARAAIKARRLPDKTGIGAMLGEYGHARTRLDPMGQVHVHGEIWSAEAERGKQIDKGEEIEVIDVSGLMLKVRRVP